MAFVEIRGLTKLFGREKAVDDVSLITREGEFLVLLGPSGCGKTTLLRMIAGLEQPDAGEIRIGDRLVNGLAPRERDIAMVFQSYALYPHMTVRRNISFPLRALKLKPDFIARKVESTARMFGIEPMLDRKPRELSGGERQRVALARAMVRKPQLFLLDEPLSNLDAKLRTSAREELKQLQRRIGITTVYVTHDQVEAMGLGNRIVVMNRGRVLQIGTPQEVYHRPTDTFVATFVGSPPMNIVEGGGTVLGFRPESFLPIEAADGGGPLREFAFAVALVEDLGADRLVYGRLAAPFDARSVIARLPPTIRVPVEAGRAYTFAIPEAGLLRFDPATGRRVPGGSVHG